MRAAIYARFSSELQDARSIDDQVALARKLAEARSIAVVEVYKDAAISGASTINRPGITKLLADAAARRFDLVITESLDRLSRSQADIAALYERLTFLDVRIETLADGVVTELHVGLKGTMSALFLKDLAQKTRRGQQGRVKAGRIPGGKSYGYEVVQSLHERGQRRIIESEAEVIRRIFQEYAEGKGPLAIVHDLNREGKAGPTGKRWNASTLLGSPKRRNGLLNNELYKGTIVYNRQRFLKDPDTGKRISRENPESEWLRQDVPELRIVEQGVWDAVQQRRAERGGPHLHHRRRPKRLLSGLLKCSCCGGNYSVVRDDFMRCSTLQNSKGCTNTRTIRCSEIEGRVLKALQERLLDPEVVAEAVETYRQERARLSAQRRRKRNELERELEQVMRQINRTGDMLLDDTLDRATGKVRMKELSTRRDELQVELEKAPEADAIAVHPQAAERYRKKVSEIRDALKQGEEAGRAAINVLREVIDHILVTPTPRPEPVKLQVVGNLVAFLVGTPSGDGVAESVVAGACNQFKLHDGGEYCRRRRAALATGKLSARSVDVTRYALVGRMHERRLEPIAA